MLSKFGQSIRASQAHSRYGVPPPPPRPHTPASFGSVTETKSPEPNDSIHSPVSPPPPALLEFYYCWWKPIVSEFTSTALLILLGCMTCVALPNQNDSPTYVPLGFGFVVLLNVQIFGHISGAYMNPAVSVAAVLWGCVPLSVGACFVVAQCLGAIVGYGLLVVISPLDTVANAICVTEPLVTLEFYQSLLIEVVLTTVMNLLNCVVWEKGSRDRQECVAVKLGLAMAGLTLAGGALTGASMNPARTLAPALWTRRWHHHWLYWVGPLIGSILPVYLYKYVLIKKQNDETVI